MKFFQFKLVILIFLIPSSYTPVSYFLYFLLCHFSSPLVFFFMGSDQWWKEFVVSPHYSSYFLFILSIALVKIYCVMVAENAGVNKGGPCIVGTCKLFENIDL